MDLAKLKQYNETEARKKEWKLKLEEGRLRIMQFDIYSRMLIDENPSIRLKGIEGLQRYKGKGAVLALAEALPRERDEQVRSMMLDVIEECIGFDPVRKSFREGREALPPGELAKCALNLAFNYPHTLAAA